MGTQGATSSLRRRPFLQDQRDVGEGECVSTLLYDEAPDTGSLLTPQDYRLVQVSQVLIALAQPVFIARFIGQLSTVEFARVLALPRRDAVLEGCSNRSPARRAPLPA